MLTHPRFQVPSSGFRFQVLLEGFIESRQDPARPGAIGLPRRLYRATAYGLKVVEAYQLLREALALRPSEAQG